MKNKLDKILFNGYVRDPIPIVFFALVVGFVFLLFSIYATKEALLTSAEYKSEKKSVQIATYINDGPLCTLMSSDGEKFDLPLKVFEDNPSLKDSIQKKDVLVIEYTNTGKDKCFDVLSVYSKDNICLISFNTIEAARKDASIISAIIMIVCCCGYWTFIMLSYYFVSRAPRYPRIASLLIRESFRNF